MNIGDVIGKFGLPLTLKLKKKDDNKNDLDSNADNLNDKNTNNESNEDITKEKTCWGKIKDSILSYNMHWIN